MTRDDCPAHISSLFSFPCFFLCRTPVVCALSARESLYYTWDDPQAKKVIKWDFPSAKVHNRKPVDVSKVGRIRHSKGCGLMRDILAFIGFAVCKLGIVLFQYLCYLVVCLFCV